MNTAKAHLIVIGFFLMGIMSAPILLGQTPGSTPISTKDLSGNDRYPLPKEGLVPDKETAIKIAEAVLVRVYGDGITRQRPYVVREDDYIWWISGTLPKDHFGQVFNIGISRHTAAVLRLTVGEDRVAAGK